MLKETFYFESLSTHPKTSGRFLLYWRVGNEYVKTIASYTDDQELFYFSFKGEMIRFTRIAEIDNLFWAPLTSSVGNV